MRKPRGELEPDCSSEPANKMALEKLYQPNGMHSEFPPWQDWRSGDDEEGGAAQEGDFL